MVPGSLVKYDAGVQGRKVRYSKVVPKRRLVSLDEGLNGNRVITEAKFPHPSTVTFDYLRSWRTDRHDRLVGVTDGAE